MDMYEEAKRIVLGAGEEIVGRKGVDQITRKTEVDFVTEVDFRVQKRIFEELSALDPAVQFIGEEKDNSDVDRAGRVWILDPIDGTMNFVHDFQHSVISLAYAEGGESQFGIVYNPYSGELFEAKRGCGAYRNGEPIHVSDKQKLSECLISVGTAPAWRESTQRTFAMMRAVFEACQDIRRMGSAALELCYVACGRLDGYCEDVLKLWDYAAAQVIIQEAGGAAKVRGKGFLAGAPGIIQELEELLDKEERE